MPDGTYASPGDCSVGKDGVLRNKAGLAVCLDANGDPMTSKSATASNAAAAAAGKEPVDDEAEDEEEEVVAKKPAAKEAAAKPAKPA